MIAGLAGSQQTRCACDDRGSRGSQALTLDAVRRRDSIGQEDLDYTLVVTEQGIAKSSALLVRQAVVQIIRMAYCSFRFSLSAPQGTRRTDPARRKTRFAGPFSAIPASDQAAIVTLRPRESVGRAAMAALRLLK